MKGKSAEMILRWGLAFVFFYAAVASLRDPQTWIGFLPQFVVQGFPAPLFLTGFSVYELALAVWLFTGRKLVWASMLAAVTLATIVVVNPYAFVITFRDIGLVMAALALFELARERKTREEEFV